jgi:hypothetical protein
VCLVPGSPASTRTIGKSSRTPSSHASARHTPYAYSRSHSFAGAGSPPARCAARAPSWRVGVAVDGR